MKELFVATCYPTDKFKAITQHITLADEDGSTYFFAGSVKGEKAVESLTQAMLVKVLIDEMNLSSRETKKKILKGILEQIEEQDISDEEKLQIKQAAEDLIFD